MIRGSVTPADVDEMRRMHATGLSVRSIGARVGLDKTTVGRHVFGRSPVSRLASEPVPTPHDAVRAMHASRTPRGASNGAAKLSAWSVVSIFSQCKADPSNWKGIASRFGVSLRTVQRIAYRQKWKDLPLGDPLPYRPGTQFRQGA